MIRHQRQPLRSSAPLTRSRMERGRTKVGMAAAARRKAGGQRAVGRASVSVAAWRAIVLELTARCGGRCEIPWCRLVGAFLDPHHVIPASLGGEDAACNVLMICRACHERFDAAFHIGKHVAHRLSENAEEWEISLQYRADKWSPLLAGSLQEFYQRPDGTF